MSVRQVRAGHMMWPRKTLHAEKAKGGPIDVPGHFLMKSITTGSDSLTAHTPTNPNVMLDIEPLRVSPSPTNILPCQLSRCFVFRLLFTYRAVLPILTPCSNPQLDDEKFLPASKVSNSEASLMSFPHGKNEAKVRPSFVAEAPPSKANQASDSA